MFVFLSIIICLILLSSHGAFLFAKPSNAADIERKIKSLTTEQKFGQVIMPAILAHRLSDHDRKELIAQIKAVQVGGYHFLIDAKSYADPHELMSLVNELQLASDIPLLMAADFEGGTGFYFKEGTRFPRAMALAASADPELVRRVAFFSAQEARRLGITVNFYPDLDINSNPENPIINIRSFGSDPNRVALFGQAYLQGYQQAGGLAVAKHFPGHGDTNQDSHLQLPVVSADLNQLRNQELKPFETAIRRGVSGIMSAHIALPQIDSSGIPATLSKKVLDGLLRDDLGFQGLIFTDALMMGGIKSRYSTGEACVLAFQAGADLLLYPENLSECKQALLKAYREGRITEARLNRSLRRILGAKDRLGLQEKGNGIIQTMRVGDQISTPETINLSAEIMRKAITCLPDSDILTALNLESKQKTYLVTITDQTKYWREGQPGTNLAEGLQQKYPDLKELTLDEALKLDSPAQLLVSLHITVGAFKGSIALSEDKLQSLQKLLSAGKVRALLVFGNPYIVRKLKDLPPTLLAYEYHPAAEKAAAEVLSNQAICEGQLPIDLGELSYK
ncbi:MAG: glycoside hydrolase family 3 N-terminal domain-containing protein [Candidatus Caenarcaniphilales bacterium]|nr:glycoside hydrolase family 3 N-terminal domain-containing protein [Candidatus Caenarcaniphilales bacterium]